MTTAVQEERLSALLGRASREVDEGRLPSCQLAVARDGELVHLATLGAATDDSRYLTFSVTKALIAAAVWVALADGALRPDTRVCEHVPSFARPGFDQVTLEHLLTHTAGFPRAPLPPLDGATSEGRTAWFAQWQLQSEPGTRTEYSPTAGHWVVAELLGQATGTDYRSLVADRVLAPLGLQRLRLGVPVPDQGDILDVVAVGADEPADATAPVVVTLDGLLEMGRPEVRAVGVPGAGAVSTAGDIALLYQAFLHNPGRLWDPAVLADATSHIRNALPDPWTKVAANRSLGLVIAGDDGHAAMRDALGRSVGPRTFGAAGASGQVAWADPDTGLSFCYLTNGLEADQVRSFLRSSSLSSLAGRLLLESAA
ncbi:MAG: penicillin-binding protein beta-lactamase class [Frankiales bacterium]|nr:penicillin-binding protein beta-lactamase class [Frankiales bacterium]